MKTAWSQIGVLLLCLCVSLYGGALTAGTTTAFGTTDMVICSDDGPKTITIDASGNPVESNLVCCNCLTCNVPTTAFLGDGFEFRAAPGQFSKLTILTKHTIAAPSIIARPQARGPPPANLENGVRAMPSCGLVFKDTTV